MFTFSWLHCAPPNIKNKKNKKNKCIFEKCSLHRRFAFPSFSFVIHHHYQSPSLLPPAAPSSLPASSPSAHHCHHPNGSITIPRTANTSPVDPPLISHLTTLTVTTHHHCHTDTAHTLPLLSPLKISFRSTFNQQCCHQSNNTTSPCLFDRKFIMEVRCPGMDAAKERSTGTLQPQTPFFK